MREKWRGSFLTREVEEHVIMERGKLEVRSVRTVMDGDTLSL